MELECDVCLSGADRKPMCASSPAAAAAPLLPLQVGQEEQPCMFQDVLIFTFGVFAACDRACTCSSFQLP